MESDFYLNQFVISPQDLNLVTRETSLTSESRQNVSSQDLQQPRNSQYSPKTQRIPWQVSDDLQVEKFAAAARSEGEE
jgi:hypothetical protein